MYSSNFINSTNVGDNSCKSRFNSFIQSVYQYFHKCFRDCNKQTQTQTRNKKCQSFNKCHIQTNDLDVYLFSDENNDEDEDNGDGNNGNGNNDRHGLSSRSIPPPNFIQYCDDNSLDSMSDDDVGDDNDINNINKYKGPEYDKNGSIYNSINSSNNSENCDTI
jgi:hypothetical protein